MPRKKRGAAPTLKKITFRDGFGEIRKETIKVRGFEMFEIEFAVPPPASSLDIGFDMVSDGQRRGDAENASIGEAMTRQIARYLRSWSLDRPVTFENIASLGEPEILFELFNVITEAGRAVKNSSTASSSTRSRKPKKKK